MSGQRRIILNHVINCRDLGGYPCKYGITKYGRFLRCAVPDFPDEKDIKELENYGVKTVIDLRGDYEACETPTDFDRIYGVETHHISLFEINVANNEFVKMSLAQSYEYIIDNHQEQIRNILEVIANAPEGVVLFHCFFGKDRTGILSMLLLHIAGAQLEDIITDYQLSYTYLLPYINSHRETLWDIDTSMHLSLPETMLELISYINEKYGSTAQYIRDTGTSEETIVKIRRKFFD